MQKKSGKFEFDITKGPEKKQILKCHYQVSSPTWNSNSSNYSDVQPCPLKKQIEGKIFKFKVFSFTDRKCQCVMGKILKEIKAKSWALHFIVKQMKFNVFLYPYLHTSKRFFDSLKNSLGQNSQNLSYFLRKYINPIFLIYFLIKH